LSSPGPHSRFTVVERYVGLTDQGYFVNAVSEIAVGPGASVDHYVVQEQGAAAFHMATIHADLERDSAFSTCEATFGARLARTTLGVRFGGEGGRASLAGLYVSGGRQHVDHHVTVDHAVPALLEPAALQGRARRLGPRRSSTGVSSCGPTPRRPTPPDQQASAPLRRRRGRQQASARDLRRRRQVHARRRRGQLAPEAIFYLRSRGLDERAARRLLTLGFVREVVDRIAVEPIRRYLDRAARGPARYR
jgi:Fe-S cluster assembly protein SufD